MDTLLEFIKGQFQIIGFIVYIVYNEYKRWRYTSTEAMNEREDLIKFRAVAEERKRNDDFRKANAEIERFVFSQLKMYKSRLVEKSKSSHEMILIGIDGILLTGLTKVKRSLLTHIEGNGYHDLSNSELEDYIEYLAGEVEDTMLSTIDKYKNVENISSFIEKHEIIDMIRRIIDTSIGIHTRLLGKYHE